jgi:choline kinase
MTMFHSKIDRVTTALLLAAGTGSRLQPLTNGAPKCLTEINGMTILERQLHGLRQQGFRRLVVVLGYLGECIREFLVYHAAGLTVDYVTNPLYRTTNNLYSLWLARKEIREPFLLVECDLVFDASLLGAMLHPDKIAVSHRRAWMNGTTVTVDPFQRVTTVQVGGSAIADAFSYKTVNICSLSAPSWQRVHERLTRCVLAGRVNEYYEAVFADMVADGSLSFDAVFFDPDRWHEVDTLDDLRECERLFSMYPDRIPHRVGLVTSGTRTFRRTPQSRTSPFAVVGAVPNSQREKTDPGDQPAIAKKYDQSRL